LAAGPACSSVGDAKRIERKARRDALENQTVKKLRTLRETQQLRADVESAASFPLPRLRRRR